MFLERSCPVPVPSDVLTDVVDSFEVRIASTKDEVLNLASKAALDEVSRDGDTATLLICTPLTRRNDLSTGRGASHLNDEPTRSLS